MLGARKEKPARDPVCPSFLESARLDWPWYWIWLCWLAVLVAHNLSSGLLRFPSDWDTLMYHLPILGRWIQNRGLWALDFSYATYPGNNELVGLWLAAPFSGDFLVPLTNLPFAAMLALSAVELGANLGSNRFFRHVTSLAIVSNVIVLKQTVDLENDLAVAALFTTALSYVTRLARFHARSDLVGATLAAGLLAGVKYYSMAYAFIALASGWLVCCATRPARSSSRGGALMLLGIVAFGGFWYFRNLVVAGNPFYPGSGLGFDGPIGDLHPDLWHTTLLFNHGWPTFTAAVQGLDKTMGPCSSAAFLAVPLTVPLLFVRRRTRAAARGSAFLARLTVGLAVLATLLVWLCTPFAVGDKPGATHHLAGFYHPARFGMCFVLTAVFALACGLQGISGRTPKTPRDPNRNKESPLPSGKFSLAAATSRLSSLAGSALALLFLAGAAVQASRLFSQMDTDLWAFLLALAEVSGVLYLLVAFFRGSWKRARVALCATSFIGVATIVYSLSVRWHHGFLLFYDNEICHGILQDIARTEKPGTRICALDFRLYPYFGPGREFVPVQPFVVNSYSELLSYLSANDAHLVVVQFFEPTLKASDGLNARYRAAYSWVSEHPQSFLLRKDGSQTCLFQFQEPAPPRPRALVRP